MTYLWQEISNPSVIGYINSQLIIYNKMVWKPDYLLRLQTIITLALIS